MMIFKKIFFCFAILALLSAKTYAQNTQLEAKAAYLLAEENYGKGDMRSALEYINEAGAKLGTPNAKISYLKVMILKEMSAKDTGALSKLDKAIIEFEKAPDAVDFNEEKTLEIVKIKLERKRQSGITNALNDRIKEYPQKFGWQIGMSTDSMVIVNKAKLETYFNKNMYKKGKLDTSGTIVLYKDWQKYTVDEMLTIEKAKLKAYTRYFYHNTNESANFDYSKQAQGAVLQEVSNQFGYLPQPTVTSDQYGSPNDMVYRTIWVYTWQSKDFTVWLSVTHLLVKSGNQSIGVITISKK